MQTVAVDDYLSRHGIQHVDLIKIDVEGHELHALRGMRKLLGASDGKAPKLFIEVNEATLESAGTSMEEIFDELAKAGYKAYRIVAKDRAEPEPRPFADSLVFFDKH